MTKKDFIHSVSIISNPDDFQKDHKILSKVDPWNYDTYLHCLARGCTLMYAYKATEVIYEVSKESALSPDNVLELIPKFRLLDTLINN